MNDNFSSPTDGFEGGTDGGFSVSATEDFFASRFAFTRAALALDLVTRSSILLMASISPARAFATTSSMNVDFSSPADGFGGGADEGFSVSAAEDFFASRFAFTRAALAFDLVTRSSILLIMSISPARALATAS